MKLFITGTAGFVGFHLARALLKEGCRVTGYDAMTDYYDLSLKRKRLEILQDFDGFTALEARLEDAESLDKAIAQSEAEIIVHLAAQAGVRYSLEAPRSYVDANLIGSFNLLDSALRHKPRHLMMASTSSVFGANSKMPYAEQDKADLPVSFYAATKKANEAMAHAYSHLHSIPTTMFRFFTVYGPWGRPDMALFKFTDRILRGEVIDVYNHGEMFRDFTYIDDLVKGIRLLMDAAPPLPGEARPEPIEGDSLSPVAPYRIVNIGNSNSVKLLDFVDALEEVLGKKAERNYMEMQPGDVVATWADAGLLQKLTGYSPETDLKEGVSRFVQWYLKEWRPANS